MNHVAIDLGGRESQICVRGADGTILDEKRHPTRLLEKLLTQWSPSRVILETSAEAFRIADAAKAAGHEVRVVPATLVKTLGVGARGVKTDQRDARTLSEVSCRIDLPSVHIPTSASRELKSICGAREELVEVRTKLINNAHGWLRGQLWRIRSGAAASFHERVRAHATSLSAELPAHIKRNLQVLEVVSEQIRAGNAQLRQIVKTDATCQAMMTVPGVGPITAARFRAAIDDASRFTSAHGVQSYLGLTPGERSSSERQRRTGITKAGPSAPRHVDPECMGGVSQAPGRADGAVGDGHRRASGQARRRRGTRPQDRRDLVRALARRDNLPDRTKRYLGEHRRDIAEHSIPSGVGCPTAAIAMTAATSDELLVSDDGPSNATSPTDPLLRQRARIVDRDSPTPPFGPRTPGEVPHTEDHVSAKKMSAAGSSLCWTPTPLHSRLHYIVSGHGAVT
jgi:transposase